MDLSTTYMGIPLKNPLVAGASSFTGNIEKLKEIQESGAAAVVLKSLFEEQLQLEQFEFDEKREKYTEGVSPEIDGFYPHNLQYKGIEGHLLFAKEAKSALNIPVIASINAVSTNTFVSYARQLEQTGVDALELNIYTVPETGSRYGQVIEDEQQNTVKEVMKSVSIPVSVKITPFYSNPLSIVAGFDTTGVKGVVLFNRIFQPAIDIENEEMGLTPFLSNPEELRLSLRFTGLLCDQINADICTSTGIFDGKGAIAALLAGANCFQIVSTLYKNGNEQIHAILKQLNEWMEVRGYKSLDDFRGKLSRNNTKDPFAYKRAQYINILWRANQMLGNLAG
ncbi:dihydroorotate dehydrogenase-like protein [Chitinispirillales bacterium ANBcel5]|uniref:dihydroorotate dehydrogenase-like protein n=1 Tax=Cellulosispirillum alkaliphilum TaxID=3039283 RepID=UPI002A55639E|nr:dihydroorotate dehydrogenase-like protein [Chitinispirillales bacterium ANBcel5]